MARLPRLVVAGQAHFVVQRGHGGAPVFDDDSDTRALVETSRCVRPIRAARMRSTSTFSAG